MARPRSKTSMARSASSRDWNRRTRRALAAELQFLKPEIVRAATVCQAERYRKHFDSFAHACLLLFHGFSHGASLRQSYAMFAGSAGFLALSGLATDQDEVGVSYSQVAASNTSRPAAFLEGIIPALVQRVRNTGVSVQDMPPALHVLDSTFLRVSLTLAGWLPDRMHPRNHGVRIQCLYQPAQDIPEQVLMTTTQTNDVGGLDQLLFADADQLAALDGHTVVFDLGYYSHHRVARMRANHIHVVTRLHPQAKVVVVADRPVQQPLPAIAGLDADQFTVLSDQIITLGSAANHYGAVLDRMRLVTARVPSTRTGVVHTYQVVTDRDDLSASLVVQCYLWRWKIELFFRWLKSHLNFTQLLGYSANAVLLSVVVRIIVHLLTLLIMARCGRSRRSALLHTQLVGAAYQLQTHDLERPSPIIQLTLSGLDPPATTPI